MMTNSVPKSQERQKLTLKDIFPDKSSDSSSSKKRSSSSDQKAINLSDAKGPSPRSHRVPGNGAGIIDDPAIQSIISYDSSFDASSELLQDPVYLEDLLVHQHRKIAQITDFTWFYYHYCQYTEEQIELNTHWLSHKKLFQKELLKAIK